MQGYSSTIFSLLTPGSPGNAPASGSLVADTGHVVTCVRAASAYCLNAQGQLIYLPPNSPRVEPNGLLVEMVSSNSMLSTDAWRVSPYWGVSGATVVNGLPSPDPSSNTAWSITATAGAGAHEDFINPAPSGLIGPGYWTISRYFKPGTVQYVAFTTGVVGYFVSAVFDLVGLAVTLNGGSLNPLFTSITAIGGGWVRCAITVNYPNSGPAVIFTPGPTIASLLSSGGTPTYTAAGTESVIAWGPQAEPLPFATSFIPNPGTGSTPTTRDTDLNTVGVSWNCIGPYTFQARVRPQAPWNVIAGLYPAGYGVLTYLAPDFGGFMLGWGSPPGVFPNTNDGACLLISGTSYFNGYVSGTVQGNTWYSNAAYTDSLAHQIATSYGGQQNLLSGYISGAVDGVQQGAPDLLNSPLATLQPCYLTLGYLLSSGGPPLYHPLCGWLSNVLITVP